MSGKNNIKDEFDANEFNTVVDPATETKQDDSITELKKLVCFNIGEHDSIELTYVAAGNGEGEIETVVYKLGVDTVATLTLTYNASNEIATVTKT